MSTITQYNPNDYLNGELLAAGASKTVYALVTPVTERVKTDVLNSPDYLDQFREAWTGKQDGVHEEFFDTWHKWSSQVVALDRDNFPFYYPTAGASEALRQIIFDYAAHYAYKGGTIHFFEGEYEGYKAMAEAAGLWTFEHPRNDWRKNIHPFYKNDLFFISQPSAIDGNVWNDFNEFMSTMPVNSVVVDVTYVGAVPRKAVRQLFNLNAPSVRNVVFSLSKPFGCYYDRIGGMFSRTEDLGLFGNRWFKNLTSLALGTALMNRYDVFYYPDTFFSEQNLMIRRLSKSLGIKFDASDVYILANAEILAQTTMTDYLRRAGRLRACLTPGMSELVSSRMGEGHE